MQCAQSIKTPTLRFQVNLHINNGKLSAEYVRELFLTSLFEAQLSAICVQTSSLRLAERENVKKTPPFARLITPAMLQIRLLTALRLSASDTAELDRCLNRSITFVIGDLPASARRTAVTVW